MPPRKFVISSVQAARAHANKKAESEFHELHVHKYSNPVGTSSEQTVQFYDAPQDVMASAHVPPIRSVPECSVDHTILRTQFVEDSDNMCEGSVAKLVSIARSKMSELDDVISRIAAQVELLTEPRIADELLPNQTRVCADMGKLPRSLPEHPAQFDSKEASMVISTTPSCESWDPKLESEDTRHFLDALLMSTVSMDRIGAYVHRHGPNVKFDKFVHQSKEFLSATPLALATMRDHVQLMQMLIDAHADPNSEYSFTAGLCRFPWSGPCLALPVIAGSVQRVQFLMELRADVHARANNGATMLWEAAYNGHAAVVEFLVESGVETELPAMFQDDLNTKYTPLHVAVKFGRRETVDTLLVRRADFSVTDKSGTTPLMDAICCNYEAIVRQLVFSLCEGLTSAEVAAHLCLTGEKMHDQLMSAITLLFEHSNPAVIFAFCQGMVGFPSIIEMLPREVFLKFLNAPLKTPLIILRACFTRHPLSYIKDGKRIILSGTYITRYGDLRVRLGAHHRMINELYLEKKEIPSHLLASIQRLAPQKATKPSQPYMTASFWMCSIADIHTDTEVMQALLKGDLDNFGDWTVISVVQFRWDRAKVGHRCLQFVNFLNMLSWTALNFTLWGKQHLDEKSSLVYTRVLLCAIALLWTVDLMAVVSYLVGHARIGQLPRYFRSAGRLIDWTQVVLPGVVAAVLQFFGTAPLEHLAFRVFLGVVVFMRWVLMIYTLRTNLTVGTAIMSILSSMMTCLPFVIVLFSFICGVWNLYLAFGILNPPDSLSVVWRMVVLGDLDLWEMDGLDSVVSKSRYDDTYYLIRVFLVLGTFFFGLSLMNVFIAILAEAYLRAEDCKWKRFYRQRALIANRNVLQVLGVRTLRHVLLKCVSRCIPDNVRSYLGVPGALARENRVNDRVGHKGCPQHRNYILRSAAASSYSSSNSIAGEKQSHLWVARPETSKS